MHEEGALQGPAGEGRRRRKRDENSNTNVTECFHQTIIRWFWSCSSVEIHLGNMLHGSVLVFTCIVNISYCASLAGWVSRSRMCVLPLKISHRAQLKTSFFLTLSLLPGRFFSFALQLGSSPFCFFLCCLFPFHYFYG
jgi:hypothetical protein